MITIPKNGQFLTQPNNSDVNGDLWASFNLDTSENQGRTRAGKKLILNTGTNDVAEITGTPITFINTSFLVYTFAGASNVGYAFKNDATMIGAFAKDVSAGSPTKVDSLKSDACFSNGAVYLTALESSATSLTSIYKSTVAGVWSEITTTENNSQGIYTNMLCSYGTRTYMSNAYSKIISLSSADAISYSGSYTLSVGSNSNDPANAITKLLPGDDRIFVLCLNLYGGQGHVYEWDGQNAQGTGVGLYVDHRLETSGALAGVMFEGNPYIVDVEGKLLTWNGGTFTEVARLNRKSGMPLIYSPAYSALNNRFIHPNGMAVVNGKIQMLIDNKNGDFGGTIEETIPSGIYEYDPRNSSKGLIHKHSISSDKANAINTNYGQVRVTGAGALKNMNIPSTASGANGQFFAGCGYYTDATTIKYGIFYDDRNDTAQKSAYLITQKLQAQGDKGTSALTNTWNALYIHFKKLLSATDKIVVKYRVTDVAPTEATITWTSTTTFTTTTDVSAYSSYECEVIQGIGSGKSAQITSVSAPSGGVYTVTVEDSFYGATGTSKARFQYWIKKDSIANQLYTSNKTLINTDSSWIQFKILMVFTGKDEIEKFVIQNSINIKAE